jgi:hydroxypyruvate isomerase
MLRFDPNLRWLFTELPMIDRYAAAAAAGFRGVESAFPYDIPSRELAKRLTDLDLTLVQVLSPFDWAAGERGLAALPGREADYRDSVERALAYSLEVGRPNVHVMPGNITPDLDRADCMDRFIRNLDWAAERAAQAGITLILEPCAKARFPEFLYHRVEEGVEVIRKIGRDNVKLCFDTFHVQTEQGSIADRMREAWPYIGHLQVGDVPGRHEPGTGEIRFPFLFDLIEELGWAGWIGCEYAPSGPTTDTLGWARAYGVGGGAGG